MVDYAKQLDDIVKALNRPASSVWTVAMFSALLAVTLGLIGQFVMMLATDEYRRLKLRGVLYRDLASLFLRVHMITEMRPDDIPWEDKAAWYQDQLRRGLVFRGEKECLDNPGLYLRLPERVDGEVLYAKFHRIIEDLDAAPLAFNLNVGSALNFFATCVRRGSLQRKYFRRVLKKELAGTLLSIVDEYVRAQEEFGKKYGLPD